MKKKTILAATALLMLVAGCSTKQEVSKVDYKTYLEQVEIIKAQKKALEYADSVMDKNQLFDTDGSDTMAKYLEYSSLASKLIQR